MIYHMNLLIYFILVYHSVFLQYIILDLYRNIQWIYIYNKIIHDIIYYILYTRHDNYFSLGLNPCQGVF